MLEHILPASLFGRLVIVLLAGLLPAQLFSSALQFQSWQQQVAQAKGLHLAQHIVNSVKTLESVAATERPLIIRALNSPRLRIFLSAAPGPAQCIPASEIPDYARSFHDFLNDAFEQNHTFCMMAADAGEIPAPSAVIVSQDPDYINRFQWYGRTFLVETQLQDGTWLGVEHRTGSDHALSWPLRLLLTLGLMMTVVITLSLLAVRHLTRPLHLLAQAASDLGRDIEQPPLAVQGPLEVRRAAQAFNTMKARLQRFIKDRARFLSAISHDLKTPVTRLRLRAEMLDDEKIRHALIKDLDEMQEMISATMDFMRGAENPECAQMMDLCALLESIQGDQEAMGHTVKINGDSIPPCPVRPLAFKRCLENLIGNGVKYGESVDITIERQEDDILIHIVDHGPGIPEDKLETVFEPFYRLESSRNRDTGGNGLGLSIARNIARAHGGDLLLLNSPGGGLEALLSLPCLTTEDRRYEETNCGGEDQDVPDYDDGR
jgi:signal transduction histidine kinase